ncbi:MAG: NAD-dependent epimerase/dehydratase family protein [Archangium sp.]
MRALVTGAAGFIGSHLADHLLGKGWSVTGLDDLSAGSLAHLESARANARFRFVQGSASDETVVKVLAAEVDVVFHLAAVVGVKQFARATPAVIAANLRSVETVLDAAASRKLPLFFASSSEVYGAPDSQVCDEDAPLTLGPATVARWSYAATKLTGEHLVLASAAHDGARSVVGRFFNTVGPRQSDRYGMVLPTFVRAALEGRPLLVHGDGSQRRSFASVHDVVAAVASLMERPEAVGRVFNIGSDEEASVLELAKLVLRVTGKNVPITLVPYADVFGPSFEDPKRRVPKLQKLEALLGRAPRRSLESIVREVMGTG